MIANARKRPRKDEPIQCPFVVLIDTREQTPFRFDGITDRHQRQRRVIVETRRTTLPTGDYSLAGFENLVSIERKSATDFFACVGRERDRFERELERLNRFPCAHVVIEADFREMATNPPKHSKLKPRAAVMSIQAWSIQFDRIHWWPMPSRVIAERWTFGLLERVWIESERTAKALAKSSARANQDETQQGRKQPYESRHGELFRIN